MGLDGIDDLVPRCWSGARPMEGWEDLAGGFVSVAVGRKANVR